LPANNDNDFPPAHKILETVAHHSVKVAGAWRPLSELKGKAKQSSINLAMTSQSGKGKCKATSLLRHADGKKQCGNTTSAHNYSSKDLNALFNI